MSKWLVTTKDVTAVVEAEDQHAAYDALIHEPIRNFGLIVTAQSLEPGGEEYSIRTSLLFHRWGSPMLAMFAMSRAAEAMDLSREQMEQSEEWNSDAWDALDEPAHIDVEALLRALERRAEEQPND